MSIKNPVKIEVSVFAGTLSIPEWVNVEASVAAYIKLLQSRLAIEFPNTEIVVIPAEAIVYNTALNVKFADGTKSSESTIATINRIQEQLQQEPSLWVVRSEGSATR